VSVVAWILLAVALVLGGALLALERARRRLRAEAAATAEALSAEQRAHADARARIEHLETRLGALRNELAEAHQENADLTARLGRQQPADASRSLGLWALERHRQARAAGTPLLGLGVGPGIDLVDGLADAVRTDLELLREEVGTHAELADVGLDETDAREALVVLRIVQELTALLAKRADELHVTVARDGGLAVVTVEARGWPDNPPSVTAFEAGLAPLDGTLELRPADEGDALVAVVRLGVDPAG
jgi:hypothetical protein